MVQITDIIMATLGDHIVGTHDLILGSSEDVLEESEEMGFKV